MTLRAAAGIGFLAALAVAMTACTPRPSCSEPVSPPKVDASRASEAQMKQMRDRVVTFQKQSDDYQECLIRAEEEHKAHPPFLSKFYNDGFDEDVNQRISANQQAKEAVVGAFNDAVRTFNRMHP